jgi:demethylmenaquinone methyltransferase/2-methoxy-6-polyprenyl-1,4-benzoquinol methylase
MPGGTSAEEHPREEQGEGASGPGSGRLRPGEVRAMFDRIAVVYDAMNTAMTAGLHHRWRARAAALAGTRPGDRVLDLATGTGDLAFALAPHVAPGGEVVGCDFSDAMLARAHAKARTKGEPGVELRFEVADALALPYAADSFDAATVGFGARNFQDLPRGLAELGRVVRGGGRVVVLEITTPLAPPLSSFYRLWFDGLVPALGRAADAVSRVRALGGGHASASGGVADAYTYLPNSVKRFPAPDELAAEMERAGIRDVSYELLAGGIVAIHTGAAPARTDAIEDRV